MRRQVACDIFWVTHSIENLEETIKKKQKEGWHLVSIFMYHDYPYAAMVKYEGENAIQDQSKK